MPLKGLLYRKIKKILKESRELSLPGFEIKKKVSMFYELKKPKDITTVDVTYPIIEPFVYVNIKFDPQLNQLIYNVIEPKLDEIEKKKYKKIVEGLMQTVDVSMSKVKNLENALKYLEENVLRIIKDLGIKLDKSEFVKIMYYIYRDFIGYNEIDPVLNDPNIEDISCDGVGIPIYVVHRIYGTLRTNIVIDDVERLRELVVKLAERAGRYVSYAEPILDATLPDGSRVAATLASDVATKGPTFTIRKFREKPFSPVEQIELGTASAEVMAYLWYLVEKRASILIVGGTSTGKTSFLNSISMFIKPEAKIVTIEDTRELMLTHEHWVPTLARPGFGALLPTGEKYGAVSLFELLKESFRQNPDYVIVGEVRGKEAYVMFQGMASGHSSMSTFHASSVEGVIRRLITPPISLSPSLLESLDVIIIMSFVKEKGSSARIVKEITEIIGYDESEDRVKYSKVFEWDAMEKKIKKVGESYKIKAFAKKYGERLEDVYRELKIREKILLWMLENGIKDFREVTEIIRTYYKDPEKILQKIGIEKKSKDVIEQEKEEVKEKAKIQVSVPRKIKRKLISVWSLIGEMV